LVAKNLGSWSKSNFAERRGEERRGEEFLDKVGKQELGAQCAYKRLRDFFSTLQKPSLPPSIDPTGQIKKTRVM
jgi:hypothetical protein